MATSAAAHSPRKQHLLLVCTLLTTLAGCRFFSASPQQLVAQAEALEKAGKLDEATLTYQKAIQKDPKYGEAYWRFGQLLARQGKGQEAFASFTLAAELLPANEAIQVDLGRHALNLMVDRGAKSESYFKAASTVATALLRKDGKSYEGLRLKALLALVEDDSAAAIDWLRQALTVRPQDPELTLSLVQNLILSGNEAEAERVTRAAIAAGVRPGLLYDLLYSLCRRRNSLTEAEKVLQMKIEQLPADDFAVIQLADYWAGQGNWPRVETLLASFLANEKQYPHARLLAGDFLRGAGKWDRAAELYEAGAAASGSRRAEYLERLARLRMDQQRPEEARTVLRQLLQAEPANAEALYALASLDMASGQREQMQQALTRFEQLVGQDPNNLEYRLAAARAQRDLGNEAKARFGYGEILKRQANHRGALREMADLAIRAQRAGDALTYAEKLLEATPADPSARLVRTAAWALQGKWSDVRSELRRMTSEYPDLLEVSLQWTALQIQEKNWAEAQKSLDRLATQYPNDLRVLERKVALLEAQQQGDRALALMRQSVAGKPSRQARILLLRTAARGGDLALAQKIATELAAEEPRDPEHRAVLGDLALKAGKPELALSQFQSALQLAPGRGDLLAKLGSVAGLLRDYPKAVDYYRQSLKASPEMPLYWNNLAFYLGQSGTALNEALSLAQRAVQAEPSNPDYLDTMGGIQLKIKDFDGALQVYQSLQKRFPQEPGYRLGLARSWLGKGDTARARHELEALLAAAPAKALREEAEQLYTTLK